MAKIPFNITYRKQIESGEYKVETSDGYPARIICWDLNAGEYVIAAVLQNESGKDSVETYTDEGRFLLNEECGYDLFIITPEPELSEFEKRLSDVVGYAISLSVAEPQKPTSEFVKEYAAELLAIAREELFANDAVLKEYAEVSREEGKAEALNVLPRWKRATGKEQFNERSIVLDGDNDLWCSNYAEKGEYYIPFSDLKKLPKEDEK